MCLKYKVNIKWKVIIIFAIFVNRIHEYFSPFDAIFMPIANDGQTFKGVSDNYSNF